MASLTILGAIYLEDMDSSQGMKNPVAMQRTKPEEKSSRMEVVQKKQATLAISQGLRNFTTPAKIACPTKVFCHCSLVLQLLPF